jgi:hypothetical protein
LCTAGQWKTEVLVTKAIMVVETQRQYTTVSGLSHMVTLAFFSMS